VAVLQERLRRPARLFHLDERFIKVSRLPGSGRHRHHDQGTVAAHDPVRGPVLAIVSRDLLPRDGGRARSCRRAPPPGAKVGQINAVADPEFRVADYGTRRRFSRVWQDEVVQTLKTGIGPKFVGTSNVKFALEQNLTPLGTMAHEYLQACQAVGPRLRDSQVFAFNMWAREYRGDLGIALSDVCGMDAFLRDFDLFFCKLFDGVRHDSGDPFEWGEKLIAHYQRMRIDPRAKTMVFSDSLNVPLAIRLYEYFAAAARPRSASERTSPTTWATRRCRSSSR
jgi:nicotinate phosphoribosyltransferase